MKRFTILLALMVTVGALYAVDPLEVTSVVSTPVTGITVITYDLQIQNGKKVNGTYDITVEVSFNNGLSYLPVPSADLSGDVIGVSPGTGKKITWNGGASFPNRYSTETKVRLTANPDEGWPRDQITQVVDVTNPTTGKTWMDRNLGASQAATSSTDAAAYGDLYQWGRAADGHQLRSSGTTTGLSGSDTPGHGNYILATNEPWDWRTPQNNDLWQGVNGANNPCPPGYRLPTDAELDAERLSWSSNNSGGAFASPLKLPLSGYRHVSNGGIFNDGSDGSGSCWSSTIDINNSWRLRYSSADAVMFSSKRASGFSVRCIKNQDPLK